MRRKIAILTNDDPIWYLAAWASTFEKISSQFEITGVWIFREKLGKKSGVAIPLWYLKTFGFYVTLCLALFAIRARIELLFSDVSSWTNLGKKYQCPIFRSNNPNDPQVVEWIKHNQVDVVLATVGHIFKKPLLNAPKIGCINKHAALLPHCRGIFPAFWSLLNSVELGVSFHEMTEEIDGGRLIFQKKYSEFKPNITPNVSMLRFYVDVFRAFPKLIEETLNRYVSSNFLSEKYEESGSYFSFPTRQDYKNLRKKGASIVSPIDILYRG